jgi:GNAT superfamily N-acetyltransferase
LTARPRLGDASLVFTMSLNIRAAHEGDLPEVIALLAQLAPSDAERKEGGQPLPEDYPRAFRRMMDAGQRLLIAARDGRTVATLALVIVPNLSHQGRPYAIIENVVVDEGARAQGIGAALVRHAIGEARSAGCFKVSLTSNKRRPAAHRFYERLGFTRTHEAFRLDL